MVSEKSSTSAFISTAIAASSAAKEAISAKKSSGRLLLLRAAARALRLRATRPGLLEAARYADAPLPEDRPLRCRARSKPMPVLSLQHPACDVYGKFARHLYVGGNSPFAPPVLSAQGAPGCCAAGRRSRIYTLADVGFVLRGHQIGPNRLSGKRNAGS